MSTVALPQADHRKAERHESEYLFQEMSVILHPLRYRIIMTVWKAVMSHHSSTDRSIIPAQLAVVFPESNPYHSERKGNGRHDNLDDK